MTLPERLGRLRRIGRIGEGGFASVWCYRDDDLDSTVAVKALADNWAQRLDVRERFLEEARILRRTVSPHLVRVYDFGEVDQVPYFVMTYARNGTLATLLETEEPLPPAEVVDLVSQMALGLDALHQGGIVHRDVKPQNLLLDRDSEGRTTVLVADLGVAKAQLQASGLTEVVGTPAYMAPEQVTGGGIDQRADVHALGAVAYQLLTGHRARHGLEDVALGSPPVPPTEHAPLPSGVDDVLLRALDRDPERRWPDVLSFTAALRDAVEQPQPAEPAAAARSVPTPAGDRSGPVAPRPARVLLLVALLLVVSFGASFLVVTLTLR